jgi:hypothetical protein
MADFQKVADRLYHLASEKDWSALSGEIPEATEEQIRYIGNVRHWGFECNPPPATDQSSIICSASKQRLCTKHCQMGLHLR